MRKSSMATMSRCSHAVSSVVIALCLQAGAAYAQDGAAAPATAESDTASAGADIVVTARRRAESVQDTPIAISALNGDALAASGVSKTSDLAQRIPNLSINGGFGSSNPQISLRGVGNNDYNDSAQATVGFYIDDVPIAAQAGKMVQTFDLQSVQVLKGPQGTLFGRNNTSGAILFTSRKPDGTSSGYVSVGASSWNTFEAEGAVGIPLSDVFSARVAGRGRVSDGYGSTIDAQGAKIKTIGAVEEFALRGILGMDAGALTGNLVLNLANADNDRPPFSVRPAPGATDALGFAPLHPDNVYEQQNNIPETEKVRTRGAFLDLDYDLGGMKLTSVTGYWYAHRLIKFDIDHSPNNLFHLLRAATSNQFSQELRISSPSSGNFTWVAGLFYLRENLNAHAEYALFSPVPDFSLYQNYKNNTRTAAVFAEGIWKFADKFSLTAGARYTYDKRILDLEVDPALGGFTAQRSQSWKKPTWRAILDYKPNSDVMLYGSISRGFQGGGYFGGSFTAGELQNGFGPEFLTAYELGFKTELLDRRVTLNGAAFYYDYKDPQVFALVVGLQGGTGFIQSITNADKATVKGFEIDLNVRPTDRLKLNYSMGVLDTAYGQLFLTNGNGVVRGDGNRLINAPTFSFSAGAEYTAPTSFGEISVQADYSYKSRQYLDITQRRDNSSAPYGVANARIALRNESKNLELALFARNLFDKRYLLYTGDLSTNFGFVEKMYGAPRSFGVQLRYKWD